MNVETRRKLQAKRFNEHLKLLTTTINAIALVIFAGAVLQPLLVSALVAESSRGVGWPWVAVSATLHLIAHSIVRLTRQE
jgi:hypothetical protein